MMNKEIKNKYYKEIFASAHINFLFGSGVNGTSFPQLCEFKDTLEILKLVKGDGLEEKLNRAKASVKAEAIKKFCEEFNKFNNINYQDKSIINVQKMFYNINKIVFNTENRDNSMKKVNIFTLNYDNIVENVLKELGYFYNQVTVKTLESMPAFDIIGYNLETNRYMPTYCIAKLHGSINNGKISSKDIIYPGLSKFNKALDADYFEVLFKMKSELQKYNSILIVMGYSGYDEHINRIIKECINNGLTVLWFKWNKFNDFGEYDSLIDKLINEIHEKIYIINPTDESNKQDTTLTLTNMLESEVLSNE